MFGQKTESQDFLEKTEQFKFDWKKINFVPVKYDMAQATLITIFEEHLENEIELNQILFCTSMTTEEEILSRTNLLYINLKALSTEFITTQRISYFAY